MNDSFSTSVIIHADRKFIWQTLTDPQLMTKWLGEPDMQLEVQCNWVLNEPIIIRGFNHIKFENKGVVLQFHTNSRLTYSHLSSISLLADKHENYSILDFILLNATDGTELQLYITNFPTEVIRKHLESYWRATVGKIKKMAEELTSKGFAKSNS
ncbi:SRPBCC family protein [Pinibacter aurantiacus]|uniref:SRPBCC domain-containing protein n=1 Tax=Pinibacter aurantiacus TaxID=2851599 RepID=A0A9E2S777_9BACT|nr:SRPBCC domain-containing protein [Pinibacter aurantiacus]MBV4357893.1 SRPBCC domain-containing protein [Pinibacter aurantiacus]